MFQRLIFFGSGMHISQQIHRKSREGIGKGVRGYRCKLSGCREPSSWVSYKLRIVSESRGKLQSKIVLGVLVGQVVRQMPFCLCL